MPQLQTLTITLTDAPGALQRVITVCNRRRLELVTLVFDRDSEDGLPRVEVCVESSPRQLAGARAWLGGLIDVVTVQETSIHEVGDARAVGG